MENPALQFKNFDEFLTKQAERFGNLPCITEGKTGKQYSYKEVNALTNGFAAFLDSLGIKKGERFAILIRNCPEFLFLYLASMKLGTLIVPLVIDTPVDGILNSVRQFDIKIIFYAEERADSIKYLSGISIQTFPIKNLIERAKDYSVNKGLFFDVSLGDPGSLYFSSGTTGVPKGIPQSPKNLLTAAAALARIYGFTEKDTQVGVLPCYHTALTTYGFLPSLWVGSNFVILERFHRHIFWESLSDFKASFVEVVPTILTMLLHEPEDISQYDVGHLKFIGSGSAPLLEPLQRQFEEKFGILVANQYGLSETAPTHFNDPRNSDRKFGSIGKTVPFCKTNIVKEDGGETSAGEIGEIVIRGDSVISGYYKNPTEDHKAFRDGWFYTGDLGYKDMDQFYFIVGRKKEMINRGGAKIYPTEVDSVLLQMPEILEAATVGIPDSVYGEEAIAYVVPKNTADFSEEKILNHCKQQLPAYKCPKKIFKIDEIPKTASGKIVRRVLLERYKGDTVAI